MHRGENNFITISATVILIQHGSLLAKNRDLGPEFSLPTDSALSRFPLPCASPRVWAEPGEPRPKRVACASSPPARASSHPLPSARRFSPRSPSSKSSLSSGIRLQRAPLIPLKGSSAVAAPTARRSPRWPPDSLDCGQGYKSILL